MALPHPVEGIRLLDGVTPVNMQSTVNGDYVSLKNVNKAFIVAHINQTSTLTPIVYAYQATAVAGTSVKALSTGNPLNIWVCETCSSDETLTKQTTSYVSHTFSGTTGRKIAVFEVDPANLDLANSFDCLMVGFAATSSGDVGSALYWLDSRYKEADTPGMIID